MRILFIITTYNRSHYLESLIRQINEDTDHAKTILVYDDYSDEIHANKNQELVSHYNNVVYSNTGKNLGKRGYWKLWDNICKDIWSVKGPDFDYYFILPDDFILNKDFINESIKQYDNIQDDNKICLSLFIEKERVDSTNWVDIKSELVQYGDTHYFKTQWMDMCIIAKRKFFEALEFKVKKVSDTRWKESDVIGSGVGAQLTKRLNKKYSLYHVSNSLCYEEEHKSMMNPNRVSAYNIQNNRRDYTQKVHVGIASIPARENLLKRTIQSLIYQVDKIYVYLNNYINIPEFLKNNPKIEVSCSEDYGDRGDAGKFFAFIKHDNLKGYYFGCDDDLIYPGDYVYTMINAIENNNRKAIIGIHGIILDDVVKDYYRNRSVIACLNKTTVNTFCHLLGTGAIAFHTDTIKVPEKWNKNMADITFGMAAQKQKVPMLCINHEGDWLHYMDPEVTIFDLQKNDCKEQTVLVNTIGWKIHTIEESYKPKLELHV